MPRARALIRPPARLVARPLARALDRREQSLVVHRVISRGGWPFSLWPRLAQALSRPASLAKLVPATASVGFLVWFGLAGLSLAWHGPSGFIFLGFQINNKNKPSKRLLRDFMISLIVLGNRSKMPSTDFWLPGCAH